MDIILDKFFFVFHSFWIALCLFGWIWRKTRKINLLCLSLTAISWFLLGIWYGYGYCPSTEWHWQVRIRLGYHDMHSSYIGFLIESMTGLRASEKFVDAMALFFLLAAFSASVLVNRKNWKKRRLK